MKIHKCASEKLKTGRNSFTEVQNLDHLKRKVLIIGWKKKTEVGVQKLELCKLDCSRQNGRWFAS